MLLYWNIATLVKYYYCLTLFSKERIRKICFLLEISHQCFVSSQWKLKGTFLLLLLNVVSIYRPICFGNCCWVKQFLNLVSYSSFFQKLIQIPPKLGHSRKILNRRAGGGREWWWGDGISRGYWRNIYVAIPMVVSWQKFWKWTIWKSKLRLVETEILKINISRMQPHIADL